MQMFLGRTIARKFQNGLWRLSRGLAKFLVLEWVVKRIKHQGFSKCAGVSFEGFEEKAMWLVDAIEKRRRNKEATVGSKKKWTKQIQLWILENWRAYHIILTTIGGDNNSKFFHMLANSHRITDFIGNLAINGFVLTQEPKWRRNRAILLEFVVWFSWEETIGWWQAFLIHRLGC